MLASNDVGEVMGTVLTVQVVGLRFSFTKHQEGLYNRHSLDTVGCGLEQMDST